MKRKKSRKAASFYMRTIARCKFTVCCSYLFSTEENPRKNSPVTVKVKRDGRMCHYVDDVEKRHTIQAERESIVN